MTSDDMRTVDLASIIEKTNADIAALAAVTDVQYEMTVDGVVRVTTGGGDAPDATRRHPADWGADENALRHP